MCMWNERECTNEAYQDCNYCLDHYKDGYYCDKKGCREQRDHGCYCDTHTDT